MIQRIQSFWLVLAACCVALSLFTPLAEYRFTLPATGQTVMADLQLLPKGRPAMMDEMATMSPTVAFSQPQAGFATWPLVVCAAVVTLLALVSIFLYKNRMRQVKVVAVGFLLCVAYDLLLLFWAIGAYADRVKEYAPFLTMGEIADMKITYFAGVYAPIVAIVFFMLARGAIRRDEAKVRAADRLR